MNPVFFIGAGPGDPQLLTLQGHALLQQATTVFLFSPYEETFADYLRHKQVFCPFDYEFSELIELIDLQRQQSPVAFLVPGDLTFFSPFQALIDRLGTAAMVVPGVGSANLASAKLKKTLDLPSVCSQAIIASPKILAESDSAPSLEQLAALGGTLLLYMNHLPLAQLVEILQRGYAKDVPIALLHRLGLPDEKIVMARLTTIVASCRGIDYFFLAEPEKRPALTLVVVGESLQTKATSNWWDEKRKTSWTKRLEK